MGYFLNTITKSRIHPHAKIDKSAKISGPVIIEKNVRILEGAKISGPAFISEGTIIGNQTLIRSSSIGQNTVVGFASEITRSYIADECWFHNNFVGDSVIGPNSSFGSGAVLANLRFDEGIIKSQVSGVEMSTGKQKFGAVIGTGVRVGVGALLMPGVKVGQNSMVGPGVILTKDLNENLRCLVKQQHEISDNRVSNIHDRQKFRDLLAK
jgi:bifunctional UDP-N-acetylglucosamine pyrophosphorylase/glucosamine-1-phosphate N-acetyltransferase